MLNYATKEIGFLGPVTVEESDGFIKKIVLNECRSPRQLGTSENIDKCFSQLEEYIEGKRTFFNFRFKFGSRDRTKLQFQVLQRLENVNYGSTVSYSDLADKIGKPLAVRAVATAVAINPLAIIIPCHRVTLKSGKIGKYAFGEDIKKQLLNLEQGNI